MKRKHIFFVLTFCFLIIVSCKKNLPLETQSGEDTFGCYINGKLFVPKGSPFAVPVLKAQYSIQNGKPVFTIGASMAEGESRHLVGIRGDSVNLAEGTYEITTQNTGKISGEYNFSEPTTLGTSYNSTNINTGQLVIKHYDQVKKIASGTFWFDAVNTNGQIVQIREGRFDVKLY
jgi:hypothetical protein